MRFLTVQLKLTFIVFVVLVTALGGVIWKTQTLLIEDKTDFITDSSMKQIAPLKRLIQQRLGDDKSRLVRFAGTRMKEGAGRARGFGDFSVIAMVQPSGQAGEKAGWTPAWVEMNAVSDSAVRSNSATAATWPKNHEFTLLKSLPYNRLRDGELIWVRMSDPNGAPVYAMMMSIEIQQSGQAREAADAAQALPDTSDESMSAGGVRKAILVGLTSVDTLASVTEDFIGSTNTVFLVDDRGYVASHVNKAYLGALFTEDPLVQEIVRSRKSASSGRFEDLESRQILAHYERIDRTNLYAVITTPEKAVSAVLASYRNTALATGAGIGLLGLLLTFFASRSLVSGSIAASNEVVRDQDEVESEAPIAEAAPAPAAKETAGESVEIEIFSDGFVEALSEPLHAVLGHAHLIKAKTSEEEIVSHAEGIERESRRVREVIERMREFQSEYLRGDTASEPSEPGAAVQAALDKLESRLHDEDILVVKDLRPVPLIGIPVGRLSKAIANVIENSIEAMQARPTKHLKIELRPDGDDHVTLTISDTGIGMPRAVAKRALEPFFKDFESPQRMGLGLSYVAAAMKMVGGSCSIDSQPGDGAILTLKFPVGAAEKAAFREREARELAAAAQGRFVDESEADLVEALQEEPIVAPTTILDHDDNDDEVFSNIALGQAASTLSFIDEEDDDDDVSFTSVAPSEAPETKPEAAEVFDAREFQVKVRKPRMKNLR
jgi:signal transduction histidine kinase